MYRVVLGALCCLLFVVGMWIAVRLLLLVVSCCLLVVCCLFFVLCCSLFAVGCLILVLSHLICYVFCFHHLALAFRFLGAWFIVR